MNRSSSSPSRLASVLTLVALGAAAQPACLNHARQASGASSDTEETTPHEKPFADSGEPKQDPSMPSVEKQRQAWRVAYIRSDLLRQIGVADTGLQPDREGYVECRAIKSEDDLRRLTEEVRDGLLKALRKDRKLAGNYAIGTAFITEQEIGMACIASIYSRLPDDGSPPPGAPKHGTAL